jgi:hypothetical protein
MPISQALKVIIIGFRQIHPLEAVLHQEFLLLFRIIFMVKDRHLPMGMAA